MKQPADPNGTNFRRSQLNFRFRLFPFRGMENSAAGSIAYFDLGEIYYFATRDGTVLYFFHL